MIECVFQHIIQNVPKLVGNENVVKSLWLIQWLPDDKFNTSIRNLSN